MVCVIDCVNRCCGQFQYSYVITKQGNRLSFVCNYCGQRNIVERLPDTDRYMYRIVGVEASTAFEAAAPHTSPPY